MYKEEKRKVTKTEGSKQGKEGQKSDGGQGQKEKQKNRRKKRQEGGRTEAKKLHLDNRVGNKISKY